MGLDSSLDLLSCFLSSFAAPPWDVNLIYTRPDSNHINLTCSAFGVYPKPELLLSWGPGYEYYIFGAKIQIFFSLLQSKDIFCFLHYLKCNPYWQLMSIFCNIFKERSTWWNDNFDNWARGTLRHFCHQNSQRGIASTWSYFPVSFDHSINHFYTERRDHVFSWKR